MLSSAILRSIQLKINYCILRTNNKALLATLSLFSIAALSVANEEHGHSDKHKVNRRFSFAVIGDSPYGDSNVAAFDNLIKDVNRDDSVNMVIHVGDIKSGSSTCTDQRLRARFNQFQQFNKPFIYTPGDNEWTDCHRKSAGRFNPLERLDFIRALFFPNPRLTTGGQPMPVLTQSDQPGYKKFVENALFRKSDVVFSTIHVVGSNNNLAPWRGIDRNDSIKKPRPDRLQEFVEREQAAVAWLKKTFAVAKQKQAQGIFITIHANPRFEVEHTKKSRAGFNRFVDELLMLTEAYKKPVLITHGDFHRFFTDKPKVATRNSNKNALAAGEPRTQLPNLTRLQTFGVSTEYWLKVTVDSREQSLFVIEPHAVEKKP